MRPKVHILIIYEKYTFLNFDLCHYSIEYRTAFDSYLLYSSFPFIDCTGETYLKTLFFFNIVKCENAVADAPISKTRDTSSIICKFNIGIYTYTGIIRESRTFLQESGVREAHTKAVSLSDL